MTEVLAFIAENWLRWVFAAATAGLAWCYRSISAKLKAEQQKNAAIAEGVQALLRESIISNYNKYQEKNCCPIYAKESLKLVYIAYHRLGGNDVATELYKKLLAMPEREEDGDNT